MTCLRNCSQSSRYRTSSVLVAVSHVLMRLSRSWSEKFSPPEPVNTSDRWAFSPSTLDCVLLRKAWLRSRISPCTWSMRDSSRLHRELSAVHCSCCRTVASRTSACQAEATLVAALSAMSSTLAVMSLLVISSSPTHLFRARKESLNAARSPRDPQSCRNCSTDWFKRVSSLTCICTCAVAFRSTLRQSSKRDAKLELFVLSTTACMALTQSIASAWNARRHMSMPGAASLDSALMAAGGVHRPPRSSISGSMVGLSRSGAVFTCSLLSARRASSPSLQTASCR
mmetsp:Transcript_26841/g.84984  ORF Transcript_26841/g.84984 Transcript_26841/m.84984 type:complete len:284 (+) Transcript_26841:632-1483(+)